MDLQSKTTTSYLIIRAVLALSVGVALAIGILALITIIVQDKLEGFYAVAATVASLSLWIVMIIWLLRQAIYGLAGDE